MDNGKQLKPTPMVSVLIAVFNGERYLEECLRSVLSQTYQSFEIVIVDDGSSDRTGSILSSLNDERIKVIRNGQNLGLTRSLNRGIAECGGTYIARLDCDDVCDIRRLEQQVAFLEKNPSIEIVGSQVNIINSLGEITAFSDLPSAFGEILVFQFFDNPFVHSSIMARRATLEANGCYNPDFRRTQDYDLWTRILRKGRGINLAPRLVSLRRHEASITANLAKDGAVFSRKIVKDLCHRYGVDSKFTDAFSSLREAPSEKTSTHLLDIGKGLTILKTALLERYPDERVAIRSGCSRVAHWILMKNREGGFIMYLRLFLSTMPFSLSLFAPRRLPLLFGSLARSSKILLALHDGFIKKGLVKLTSRYRHPQK